MKYRTKLYIALVGIAVGSTLLALTIIYKETQNQFLQEIQSKVTSIAATAASLIDADALKKIQSPADENTPSYFEIKNQLRKVRDANRREDVYVKYVYTLRRSASHPNEMLFGVDAEDNPKELVHVGDVDPNTENNDILKHLNEDYSPGHFIADQWGLWLTGFAPIHDKNGEYVGTLGIDLMASIVIWKLHRLLNYEFIGLLVSILAAVLGAFYLSRRATFSLNTLCASVEEIGKGDLNTRVHLETQDEFNDLADAVNEMAQGLQERERLKVNFAHYVSQYILEKIIKSDTPMKLEGERRKVTILFSDIRSFTRIAEKLPPEQVVSLLNEYFEQMIEVIFRNYGTLDKFIGDGIMVEFGAPLEDLTQEKHAVRAAIEMQAELKKLCEKWEKEGKPTIKMGIGIHTGIAIVGNIGSEQRMEYTAVGDTVNVASRIEGATKTLNASILISEMTAMAIKEQFPLVNLGPIVLPGRTEGITVFAIQGQPPLA